MIFNENGVENTKRRLIFIAIAVAIVMGGYKYWFSTEARAERYYKEGQELVQSGEKDKLDEAVAAYTKAIELNPQSAKAYVGRANARTSKDCEKAIEDCNKAIEIDPKNSDAYLTFGKIYSKWKKDYEAAFADYNQVVMLDPQNVEARLNRGYFYQKKKDFGKAIEDFTAVINNKDADPEKKAYAYSFRGFIYEHQNNYIGAIENFTKSIELIDKEKRPQIAAAEYDNRGRCYLRLEEFQRALADHTKAIEIDPQCIAPYSNRAFAYINLNNATQAVADCTEYIRRTSDPFGYSLRARAYRQLGDIAKAEADEAIAEAGRK